MCRSSGLSEKKQQFLQSRIRLSLLLCAVLLLCAFVCCVLVQAAREKRAHSAVIGTRIAIEETQPPTVVSPVPNVEITQTGENELPQAEATPDADVTD